MTKKITDGSNKRQHAIRMDDELEARIGKYQQKIEKATGAEISFSSAGRALIEKGLEAVKL